MLSWLCRGLLPIALAAGAGACGSARESTPGISAAFACENDRRVQAVFTGGARPSVQLTLSDGRRLLLPQAPSASGARYANGDESFVFWNKGRTAFIEEGGQRTYAGCTQLP